MIDELKAWGVNPPVVVADAGYGDNGLFRTALTTRGLDYVVQVKGLTSVHPGDVVFDTPEYSGFGRPKKPSVPDPTYPGPGTGPITPGRTVPPRVLATR
ncbi:hypothetical protein HMPREF0290_0614 [Corynebacterium efficiens YS-314]|uniref:Transposase IS701-like DDE domain-containing protein n=1 Tax=Corynebacterium efficiens (strain DSM 44549 / YS-314 / AJ 12310 / JCM 11189 / NBRC 100395) TaxID=196164 RepID=Q8FQ87_COREF|nr:transposase [Corynebacterium efficiens]EEW50774.1 hypothetical protein HMPREF0290_0614 [Corynebacterium efficiens YS-314]BAC18056.1 hypothetical protein [Corynebacterium efficiens YS-314]